MHLYYAHKMVRNRRVLLKGNGLNVSLFGMGDNRRKSGCGCSKHKRFNSLTHGIDNLKITLLGPQTISRW